MRTFSYDVEYAKQSGIVRAIISSYLSIVDTDKEHVDILKLCSATGLDEATVREALGREKDSKPIKPVVPIVPASVVTIKQEPSLFVGRKIVSTNKPRPANYADAICKHLPELVSNQDLISALDRWVRVIYKSGKGITKEQVIMAIAELKDICGEDIDQAIKIVNIATQAGYKVFSWCAPTQVKMNKTSLTHNSEFTPRKQKSIDVMNEGF